MQSIEFFEIEGMTPKAVDSDSDVLSVDYINDLQPFGMRIRIDLEKDNSATVKIIDPDGTIPGADRIEQVPMAHYNPAIAERIVRALAVHHLGLEDVSNYYTALDLEMINRGFSLGLESGSHYGWSACVGPFIYFLSRPNNGGIPVDSNGASKILCIAPDARRIVFCSDNLGGSLKAFDSGDLPGLFEPDNTDDIFINGVDTESAGAFH